MCVCVCVGGGGGGRGVSEEGGRETCVVQSGTTQNRTFHKSFKIHDKLFSLFIFL